MELNNGSLFMELIECSHQFPGVPDVDQCSHLIDNCSHEAYHEDMNQYSIREAKARFSEVIKESCEIKNRNDVVAVILTKEQFDKFMEKFEMHEKFIKEKERRIKELEEKPKVDNSGNNAAMSKFLGENKLEAKFGEAKCQKCFKVAKLTKTKLLIPDYDSGESKEWELNLCAACYAAAKRDKAIIGEPIEEQI